MIELKTGKVEHKITIHPVPDTEVFGGTPTRFDVSFQVGNSGPIWLGYFESENRAKDLKDGIEQAFHYANKIIEAWHAQ